MLEDPALDQAELAAALHTAYGIQALEFRFVRSYDLRAASFDVAATDGRHFLKVHFSPLAAPRERDLLFIIGSRIARDVAPHEEAWFFEGYGDIEVDPEAIIYYRYERIFEDIAETGMSVFGDPALGEASRESQVRLLESFFSPGGIVETVG